MKNLPMLRSLLAGLFSLTIVQTGLGQSFTEGLNNSVTNVTVSGGAYYTGNSGTGDRPATSPFAIEGTDSRGVTNNSATITSNAINTTGGTGIALTFRLASFSIGSTSNGADGADTVIVAISPDGGTTYYDTLTVAGNNNAQWSYTGGTGVASTPYDGNATPVSFTPAAGGNRTTDGYSTVTVTNLPAVASMRFRVTMLNNSTNERWVADNIVFSGTFSPPPTITGAATASAFTTTYGTPSAAQTFSVSGANLTANLVATAPTGFEVASNGTTFGGTATFTQSGGNASGTLSLRLKATAAAAFYNSKNIVLSSTGATSVNITTAEDGNRVTAKALAITASAQTKTYGASLPLGTSLYSPVGLENSETIGAVTLTSSGSSAASAVGSYPIIPSAASGGTFTASNYIITYNNGSLTVDPKALTITAIAVTKASGDTLASPVIGSTAFTSDGLVSPETIGSVTITYGTGAASGDAAGAYTDQVTPSAAVDGTFDITNYLPTYVSATLTVTAEPTITVTGALAAVDTTYGTPSAAPSSFTVSGIFLTGDLTVTPPAGFEVSSSIGSGYSTSLSLPASGTLGATTVYLRLAAASAFGAYSGNITVAGGGAASKTIATASSNVAKKGLSITGLSGNDKPYDRAATATTSGTAIYVGLENGEVFAVVGTPTASFSDATAAPSKPITITGFTAPSDNYSVTQPTGLTAEITKLALTVTGSTVAPRPYNTTDAATITGASLVGVISPDVVTIATSTGNFATANAGTGIAVTAALTLGGADAGNYSLTQPTDLVGDITKLNQFITFTAPPDKLTTDPSFVLSASGGASGQPVTFVADPSSSVIVITGNSCAIVGAGTANITASQAGDTNYNAATDVIRTQTVIVPPLANWTSPWSGTAASPLAATTKKTNLEIASLARVGLTGVSSSTRYSSSGWNTTANYLTATLTAASGYLVNLNGAIISGTWSSTSTGPGSFDVRSSVDNYATSIGTFASGFSTSITLPATTFNNLSTITFRFIGSATGLNGSPTQSGGTGGPSSLIFNGDVIIAPSITGAATTTAFTTTYGAPSAEQSFSISGAALTADITATAPTGFEVSSDGTSYGSAATFTPASGTASGSLRIRLAATAAVSGSYDSQNIVLTSTGATAVNITTASSGNLVSKATPTITTAPTGSGITSGQTLASSSLTGGVASVDGTFAFTTPGTTPAVGTANQDVTFTPTDTANYNNATTSVSVTVNSGADPLFAADGKSPTITIAPGVANITFTGIPGRTYGIQRSTTLATDSWTEIDTVTADPVTGATNYQDQNRVSPAAFYRVVYPPAAAP